MPDLPELLRHSVTAEVASFEPSADLPQRIARRTLELQRRRRASVVVGAAVLAVGMLALPLLVNPMRNRSNAVSVPYAPVNANAEKARKTTTTTTKAGLDPAALKYLSVRERQKALKKLAAAAKKKRHRNTADKGADAEVLGATATRGSAPKKVASPHRTTTTTRRTATSTTRARTTTTTAKPPATTVPTTTVPTTTPTTTPGVPFQIIAPDHVCAGVPAVFRATGSGSDQVVWSNAQVGALAIYVLAESTSVSATLNLGGSVSTQSYGVQVIPTGTPPC